MVSTLDILKSAIIGKKTISFSYNKNGELSHRIAHPYIIYRFTSKKSGEQSVRIDFVQVGGDTDSSNVSFPCFKNLIDIENISNIRVMSEHSTFGSKLHRDYNPRSDRYENTIIRV